MGKSLIFAVLSITSHILTRFIYEIVSDHRQNLRSAHADLLETWIFRILYIQIK